MQNQKVSRLICYNTTNNFLNALTPRSHILIDKFMKLRHELTTSGATTNNDERQQSIALYLWNRWIGCTFETLKNTITDLTCMVEMLKEKDYYSFESLDATLFVVDCRSDARRNL